MLKNKMSKPSMVRTQQALTLLNTKVLSND